MKIFSKNFQIFGAFLLAVIMVVCTAPNTLAVTYAKKLEGDLFGNYYVSDFNTKEESTAHSKQISQQLHEEGYILLKNEDNALPIAEGSKITLLGKNSVNMVTRVWGSGEGTREGEFVTVQEAFFDEGLILNPVAEAFYRNAGLSGQARSDSDMNASRETPISLYTQDVIDSFDEYNDLAVVFVSRLGGEGKDVPRSLLEAESSGDHALQLDKNEADLMQFAGEHFDKVLVIFNTGSQFEAGFLDDPGHYGYHENLKAALWVGFSGRTSIRALPRIIKGEVNPSGHTVDTWARDFKEDPTWSNYGDLQYSNTSSKYVVYKEGIYLGYRYYETRGFDEGNGAWTGEGVMSSGASSTGNAPIHGTTTTEWSSWYDAHVVYPFGYGLSYTTFSKEIVSKSKVDGSDLASDDVITLTVRVTNAGSIAGKEVVQLYYTAPYTAGGIEKAHVVLCGFEKTKLLQPGESQDLALSVKVRDMSSYDYNDANGNGFKGYELDEGKYTLRVMENAHDEIDHVDYNVKSNIQYSTDSATGNPVNNLFDEESNYLTNSTDDPKMPGLGEKYMTRADFEGTYPIKASAVAPDWVVTQVANRDDLTKDPDTPDKPYYTDVMPTQGVVDDDNVIMLKDLHGKSYDDPLWETFLNQLSVAHLKALVLDGNYASGQNFPRFGIKRMANENGAGGVYWSSGGSWGKVAWSGEFASYGMEIITATSWNKELSYLRGLACSDEALWDGIVGFYSTAVNTHRTPFGGRNYEYYSEDGYLTGVLATEQVKGVQENGMYPYVKHFGLNDQEINRWGILTWANEQSMREIYYRPFEICVKEGNTRGIMSALNRIGTDYSSGKRELLTDLLRAEWGFQGCVVTDTYGAGKADRMIRAGGNLALGIATNDFTYEVDSPTSINCLRDMAHGLLYAHANSMAINENAKPTLPDKLRSFNSSELVLGFVDTEYSCKIEPALFDERIVADGDPADIVYSINSASLLPDGLQMSPDGTIFGVPTRLANNMRFYVDATYEDCTLTTEFTISILDNNGSIVYSTDNSLGTLLVGQEVDINVGGAYIYKKNATQQEIDNYPSITYNLSEGSALPEGLTLSSVGRITGTPTKYIMDYSFSVDANAFGFNSVKQEFTLKINVAIAFENETAKTLALGKYGDLYFDMVDKVICENKATYSLKEGSTLPAGLTLTQDGYIIGDPTMAVSDHAFTVVVSAPYAESIERDYVITVGVKMPAITLVDGKVGDSYRTRIDFAQGAPEVVYSAQDLPDGITLSEDGVLSGEPLKAGNYKVTIIAESEGMASDAIMVNLFIANGEEECGCNGSVDYLPLVVMAVVCAFVAMRSKRRSIEK